MRHALIIVLAFGLLTGAAYSGFQAPQGPQRQDPPAPFVIPIDVVRVTLLVSVTDNRGQLITNLRKEDFRVFEDDQPQTLLDFRSETDLPLSIALLVDGSASVVDKLKFEQDAAVNFFYNTIKRGKDRANVVEFNSRVTQHLPNFTDDPETLAGAVQKIRAGGGTAVFDAVYHSVKDLLAGEDTERRRLVILISDGDDTQSDFSLAQALEMAQKHDVSIHAISTNRTSETRKEERERGDRALRALVEETGGRVYFPLQIQDLDAEFAKIGQELRSQYVLFYQPTNSIQDGRYRRIRVELKDRKYKATVRDGYYADSRGTQ